MRYIGGINQLRFAHDIIVFVIFIANSLQIRKEFQPNFTPPFYKTKGCIQHDLIYTRYTPDGNTMQKYYIYIILIC